MPFFNLPYDNWKTSEPHEGPRRKAPTPAPLRCSQCHNLIDAGSLCRACLMALAWPSMSDAARQIIRNQDAHDKGKR